MVGIRTSKSDTREHTIRIAIVIQHYPPFIAGAERQASLLAKIFSREFGTCDVITTRFRGDLPRRSREGGISILRLPTLAPRPLKLVANTLIALMYFIAVSWRFTHFHVNNLSPSTLGAMIGAKVWRRPVMLKIGSLGPGGEIARVLGYPFGPFLWRVFRSADTFIAPTDVAERELLRHGIPGDRIHVVPNALGAEWVEPLTDEARRQKRRQLGLSSGPVALFAGRLTREKGVPRLIEAWARAASKNHASLILLGDGPERAWIEQRRREIGRGDGIIVLGWQEDPQPFFEIADIFAFPSESETFGNVLAEAMASGLAIVSTPVGIAASHFEHGRNALLSPHDGDAFAERLSEVLRDHGLRERLGKAAANDARMLFGEAVVARAYGKLLNSAISVTADKTRQRS